MACLALFCTNAINILAGVNGLESGQAVVIGATIVANNAIQLYRHAEGGALHDNNLFSLYLTLPFVGVSLGLAALNWYPSRVFVGDTYCYFAGMTFAVAAILGHFSKTLLLFFVPQVLNFVYSLPQLFRIVPCPRHRMPAYVRATDTVDNSFADIDADGLSAAGRATLRVLEATRLAIVQRDAKSGRFTRVSNLTLINYVLYLTGPIHEATLCKVLLALQAACSVAALLVRYQLAGLLYDVVR